MSLTQPFRRRRSGAVVATVAALALTLTACGSGETQVSAAESQDQADKLVELLALEDETNLGGDLDWTMGAALTLSGTSAANGESMKNAIELAIDHIESAGGPAIDLSVKDIKDPDPVASQQAAEELAAEEVPAKITSMGDGFGTMLASTDKSEILSLDGVGGAQVFTQGSQYFYGTREVAPADALPGMLKWAEEALPDATTVGLVGVDLGPFNDPIKADIEAKIAESNLEFNGLWETVTPDTTDYASLISKVQENEPDVLITAFGGGAPGAFVAQATQAGVEAELVGIEFTQEAVKASKGVLDSEGFKFAMDYFDPDNPTNPLAELFVDSYQATYDEKPDFYAANAYEETLLLWELVRRVLADGGDPDKGSELRAALEADPVFPSVYGGDEQTVGTLELDPKTHGVASRPMGVYEYKGGQVTPLATFNVGGSDFELN